MKSSERRRMRKAKWGERRKGPRDPWTRRTAYVLNIKHQFWKWFLILKVKINFQNEKESFETGISFESLKQTLKLFFFLKTKWLNFKINLVAPYFFSKSLIKHMNFSKKTIFNGKKTIFKSKFDFKRQSLSIWKAFDWI